MNYYTRYLRSPWWLLVRVRELERAGHCCEFCGTRPEHKGESLQVHHLSYDHLGQEPSWDLIVLCDSCHTDAHQFPKRHAEIEQFADRRPL